MAIGNLKEFKALIDKYESMTAEDFTAEEERTLTKDSFERSLILKEKTGYGSFDTCTLCEAVEGDCSVCMHSKGAPLSAEPYCEGNNYNLIHEARSLPALLAAYKARAAYMREILTKYF